MLQNRTVNINMMSHECDLHTWPYNFADFQLPVDMEKVYALTLLLAVGRRKLSNVNLKNGKR